ncbi:LOW QUALITY PROTEIN: hypothetical protein MXB_3659 [Myxobolus squamalis]|nr:LOW QUALITY PROTEIN: hypothetical protein MXB_3659 [Myxobolus squamalis]
MNALFLSETKGYDDVEAYIKGNIGTIIPISNPSVYNQVFYTYINKAYIEKSIGLYDSLSAMKRFLIGLDEPILTHKLRAKFFLAEKLNNTIALYSNIKKLPPANRDTLCVIIDHIQYMSKKSFFGFNRREELLKFYAPDTKILPVLLNIIVIDALVSLPNRLIRSAMRLTRLEQEKYRRKQTQIATSIQLMRSYDIPDV